MCPLPASGERAKTDKQLAKSRAVCIAAPGKSAIIEATLRPADPDSVPMDDSELLRYSRHILLPEIGIDGQEHIAASHVLIIGAGGLGSPAALFLASAGVGTITLCDADVVDLTNLQRQIAHDTSTIGLL